MLFVSENCCLFIIVISFIYEKSCSFRIREPGRDPGFGQSILHEGQLLFRTPPYGSQDISLQEPASGWDSNVGNPKGTGAGGLKVCILFVCISKITDLQETKFLCLFGLTYI